MAPRPTLNSWWAKLAERWPLGLAFALGLFAQGWANHVSLGGHPMMESRMDKLERHVDKIQTRMNYLHPSHAFKNIPKL